MIPNIYREQAASLAVDLPTTAEEKKLQLEFPAPKAYMKPAKRSDAAQATRGEMDIQAIHERERYTARQAPGP